MSAPLVSPRRSKVTAEQLSEEVAEYFALGVRLAPGDTVLDVGANIGAFALRAAQACDGNLRILAFEPSPDTFEALEANFEANAVLRRTVHRLFRLGLSSSEGAGESVTFYDFSRYPTNSTFQLAEKRREYEMFFEDLGRRTGARIRTALAGEAGHLLGETVAHAVAALSAGRAGWWVARRVMGIREHVVRLDTLPHVLERERIDRIDLLKIDVEGPELEILRGLDAATWGEVRQIVLETHDRDGRLAQIEALLREHGLGAIRRAAQQTGDNGRQAVLVYARRPDVTG
jgi:FkbM family methyltransferase